MQNLILTAIFYALFQIFSGLAATRLSDLWFLILGTISISVFTGLIIIQQLISGETLGKITPGGIGFIFIANAFISLFTLFLARSFQTVDIKLVIPFVFGGAILLSSMGNFLLAKSLPNLIQTISLLTICSGILLFGYGSTK